MPSVPQFLSEATVVEGQTGGSRVMNVPQEVFEDGKYKTLGEIGELAEQWVTTKHGLKTDSEAAVAGAALQTQLDSLVRDQMFNPDPHNADVTVKEQSEAIYRMILQNPALSGDGRSKFRTKYGLKPGEALKAFRSKNDPRIIEFGVAATDEVVVQTGRDAMDMSRTIGDRMRSVIEIFGNRLGGPNSFSLNDALITSGGEVLPANDAMDLLLDSEPGKGLYQQAFEHGLISMKDAQTREAAVQETVYSGILTTMMAGHPDPTSIVLDIEAGEVLDPVLDLIGKKMDPAKVAELHQAALAEASKIETGRREQSEQQEQVEIDRNEQMYLSIFNKNQGIDAAAVVATGTYELLKLSNFLTPIQHNAIRAHFKNMGWNEDGTSAVFRSTEDGSVGASIVSLEALDFDGELTMQAVLDHQADLTQQDYLNYMGDASRLRADVEQRIIKDFSDAFDYEEFKDTFDELGNAPRAAFTKARRDFRVWHTGNPRASAAEMRAHGLEIIAAGKEQFIEDLTLGANDYLRAMEARLQVTLDKTDLVASIQAQIGLGGPRGPEWVALLQNVLYYQRKGVEFK